ncbi:hypothetical protein B4V02_17955 [Paenibacillus kribbensis]|uniref:Uncharacterized protein n=1 Tax=Paenibacillus kribbensis TaxID=172713 RepID=A0A222WPN4_9BACL|nr:hypothetical protein [Paenibacillus kribbensis]ASR48449.1 hypothetical protein B4V02_17955 [Paenibacillus kribbensis]
MKISKIIKQTIGKKLENLNFAHEYLNNTWIFTRVVNGFKETIQIEKSYWSENALRITFMTEAESVYSFYFIDGSKMEKLHYYEDEESLRDIFITLEEIIDQHALKWFEENVPKDTLPPANFLDKGWFEKLQKFVEVNNIDFKDENSLKTIEFLLISEPTEETIVLSSYFLGELFIQTLDGEWDYDQNYGPYIKNIGGINNFNRRPYKTIKNFANNPHHESIIRPYQAIAGTVKNVKGQ